MNKLLLTLLAISIIIVGLVTSLVFDQYILGLLISVPGWIILPSFNIPKTFSKYLPPISLGFDIFVLFVWFVAFLPENTEAIASLFGVSRTIILVIGAWFALGLVRQFMNNINEFMDSIKVNKKVLN